MQGELHVLNPETAGRGQQTLNPKPLAWGGVNHGKPFIRQPHVATLVPCVEWRPTT